MTVTAQNEQFSIASLNTDGLPQKILFVNINADGPGVEGSLRIGKYFVEKQYDLVFMQEDFNYHAELALPMLFHYDFDQWSGSIGLFSKKIDFFHLQNLRFDCDGLGAAWKKCIQTTCTDRVAWDNVFGKFSHALDELATKGFRRYEVTLPSGGEVVVYNVHLDASARHDVPLGLDMKDRQTRVAEWQQVIDHILSHIDHRPIIVLGDVNCFYWRDPMEACFIDAVNATGVAQAHDVWVELEHGGQYPEHTNGTANAEGLNEGTDGETFDKIVYINPVDGRKLKPVSYTCDREGFQHDGKPLGDHYPIAATFEFTDEGDSNTNKDDIFTGVSSIKTAAAAGTDRYDLSGRKVSGHTAKGLYIERVGNTTRKRIIK